MNQHIQSDTLWPERSPVAGSGHRLILGNNVSSDIAHTWTLANRFDPRANNFDAIRLFAAALVLFSHCYPLTRTKGEPFSPLGVSGGDIAVAVFFVISGFLITRSLQERSLADYVLARALRILPGLAAVILLAAFVIGPGTTTLPLLAYLAHSQTWNYLSGIFLVDLQFRLPGVFESNPYRYSVNGPLWTIPLEAVWYLILPIFAVLGLLHKRAFWGVLLIFLIAYAVGVEVYGLAFNNRGPQLFSVITAYPFLRYGAFFLIGTALWLYRGYIPMRGSIAAGLAVGLFLSAKTPVFSALLTVALPYLVFYVGVRGSWGRSLTSRVGDLSYGTYLYAFPTQQTIAHLVPGIEAWQLFAGALPVTLALAALSWHCVEQPMLRIKKQTRSVPLTSPNSINSQTVTP